MQRKFENEEPPELEIESEMRLTSNVVEMKWCLNMDLIGVITDNNVFEVKKGLKRYTGFTSKFRR